MKHASRRVRPSQRCALSVSIPHHGPSGRWANVQFRLKSPVTAQRLRIVSSWSAIQQNSASKDLLRGGFRLISAQSGCYVVPNWSSLCRYFSQPTFARCFGIPTWMRCKHLALISRHMTRSKRGLLRFMIVSKAGACPVMRPGRPRISHSLDDGWMRARCRNVFVGPWGVLPHNR